MKNKGYGGIAGNVGIKGCFCLSYFIKLEFIFSVKYFKGFIIKQSNVLITSCFFRLKTKLTVLPLIHVIFFLAFQIIPVRLKGARYNVGDKEVTHPLLLN